LTKLVTRKIGPNSTSGAYHDAVLAQGGITLANDSYNAADDRIYDTRGLLNVHTEINNSGLSSLSYRIETARIEYDTLDQLTDADFNKLLLDDTIIPDTNTESHDIINISPETTAIRIRLRRSSGITTTYGGIFAANEAQFGGTIISDLSPPITTSPEGQDVMIETILKAQRLDTKNILLNEILIELRKIHNQLEFMTDQELDEPEVKVEI